MSDLLGFQSQHIDDSVLDIYRDARASVFKPINIVDRRLYQRYRSEVNGWIFPRIYCDDIPFVNPKQFAQATADRTLSWLDPVLDLVDATFFQNERFQTTAADLDILNESTCYYIDILHPRGCKVVVGTTGVGNPTNPRDITHLADALRAGDLWSYHSYDAPTMQRAPADCALRYRSMRSALEDLHDPRVLKPLVVDECGIDGGVLGSQHVNQGYRSFGIPILPQAQWFLSELRQDDYVIAAAFFGLAMGSMWRSFDLRGESDLIHWLAQSGQPNRGRYVVDPTVQALLDRVSALESSQKTILAQNAILTECWKAFRQGKFTGADGIDGCVVQMTGKPLDYQPTYPKA